MFVGGVRFISLCNLTSSTQQSIKLPLHHAHRRPPRRPLPTCCLWSKPSWEVSGRTKFRSSSTSQSFPLGNESSSASPNSPQRLSMLLLASKISSLSWKSSTSSLEFACSLMICSKASALWLMIKNCRKPWAKITPPLTLMRQRSGTSNSMEWASRPNG
ncbi:hypothetical protein ACN38_g5876 [Penicillium nordicum]|uniref:Uncharacterized protein n=1 Tax=Penicillium nordicum TaxID=229535 RepID=A0A0M8P925_9EURO|nr:hypothetical protein ACN38_g5876 [Penicillium nordicum]